MILHLMGILKTIGEVDSKRKPRLLDAYERQRQTKPCHFLQKKSIFPCVSVICPEIIQMREREESQPCSGVALPYSTPHFPAISSSDFLTSLGAFRNYSLLKIFLFSTLYTPFFLTPPFIFSYLHYPSLSLYLLL